MLCFGIYSVSNDVFCHFSKHYKAHISNMWKLNLYKEKNQTLNL